MSLTKTGGIFSGFSSFFRNAWRLPKIRTELLPYSLKFRLNSDKLAAFFWAISVIRKEELNFL
jgi:hypothetical protein